jgi:hypothetical protein
MMTRTLPIGRRGLPNTKIFMFCPAWIDNRQNGQVAKTDSGNSYERNVRD